MFLLSAAAPFALALAASPAYAQQPAGAEEAGTEVEEVVVTGTLFRRTTTETPSPVTVISQENLQDAGITTAAAAIRTVSADSAGSIAVGFQSGFSAGGAAVSLRGLGVASTLVLVDGLRSANFPISDDGHNSYVDLNSIPFSLIERVEVLKDGASSTYGADAIGGVVNLITTKRYQGIRGSAELGTTQKRDGDHGRADLTVGFGDYDATGWNILLNAEYQVDGRVTHHSRGFPYNNRDLTSIGGKDGNAADSSLTTSSPNAIVTRVGQVDLNNPFAGGALTLSGAGTSASPAFYNLITPFCPNGTFTLSTGGAQGTACKHNPEDEYLEMQPWQERVSYTGRLNVRLTEKIEAYVTGTYSRDVVSIHRIPQNIRVIQPFGASTSLSSLSPGIVLPVWICPTGVDCANVATPGRTLNPNNPYAAAFASDPSNGAARIYYLFGDVVSGSDRKNEVFRGAAGLTGEYMGWDWKVDAVGAKDNLLLTDRGYFNIAGLKQAINTGSYNFVDPRQNSADVRNAVLPDVKTPSTSSMQSLEGSISKALFDLPGGPLQLALGAQVRHEQLTNNNRNPQFATGNLTRASAFGEHTVRAAYFELDAPVHDMVDINLSGRFDDYSEGFSHFSPKVGVKVTPFRQLAFRGTWSEGFRAPTFAESGPLSQYSGFAPFPLPANFVAAHGGVGNSYNDPYQLGQGLHGNPDLKPEISHAYTLGLIAQPTRWLSFTVDYYNVKKDDLIVAGEKLGDAKAAYYSNAGATVAQACAAVAAVGPGYSCDTIGEIDPLFPNALPKIIVINAPFVNASSFDASGIDVSATGRFHLPYDTLFTSKVELTQTLKSNLTKSDGTVEHYAGTLGPMELSSGNGTPKLRGNWQNTFERGILKISTTTYFVDKIRQTAADETSHHRVDCVSDVAGARVFNGQYTQPATGPGSVASGTTVDQWASQWCYVKRFWTTDLNATVKVKEGLSLYADIGNVFNARAPLAAAAYSSAPNYLITWSTPGVIGRTYKIGARFEF